jgi:ABC-2 type transport system ATP-binding protein
MTEKPLAIDIQNLTKYYRGSEKPAIESVTLGIAQGHIFGLLGPNGAGKTTMIRILCGLLTPTGGEITIGGYSLKRELASIRKIIGVVPQEIALYQSLTARENLAIYGGISGLKGEHLKKRIDEQLLKFGLEKSRNIQVGRFSGGMKRRLNLIVGLMHDPRILFLDEPTVGVDVQSKNVIIESLLDINQSGTTIIYTSHYLEEAETLCSSLAIIDEARIITKGSLNEIRKVHNSHAKLEDIFLQLTGKSLRD